jgi:hypothetical protein
MISLISVFSEFFICILALSILRPLFFRVRTIELHFRVVCSGVGGLAI